jgi:hypothetical protein
MNRFVHISLSISLMISLGEIPRRTITESKDWISLRLLIHFAKMFPLSAYNDKKSKMFQPVVRGGWNRKISQIQDFSHLLGWYIDQFRTGALRCHKAHAGAGVSGRSQAEYAQGEWPALRTKTCPGPCLSKHLYSYPLGLLFPSPFTASSVPKSPMSLWLANSNYFLGGIPSNPWCFVALPGLVA